MITKDIVPKSWKLNPIGKKNLAIRCIKETLKQEDSFCFDEGYIGIPFIAIDGQEMFVQALKDIINSNDILNERYLDILFKSKIK